MTLYACLSVRLFTYCAYSISSTTEPIWIKIKVMVLCDPGILQFYNSIVPKQPLPSCLLILLFVWGNHGFDPYLRFPIFLPNNWLPIWQQVQLVLFRQARGFDPCLTFYFFAYQLFTGECVLCYYKIRSNSQSNFCDSVLSSDCSSQKRKMDISPSVPNAFYLFIFFI